MVPTDLAHDDVLLSRSFAQISIAPLHILPPLAPATSSIAKEKVHDEGDYGKGG